jgi:hypothetical protein
MAINVEPIYETGSAYHLGIIWDTSGRNWTRQLIETARTQASHSKLIQVTKKYYRFLKSRLHLVFFGFA